MVMQELKLTVNTATRPINKQTLFIKYKTVFELNNRMKIRIWDLTHVNKRHETPFIADEL